MIVFIVGLTIGAFTIASMSGNSLQKTWEVSEMKYRADIGNRVWQAYKEESPNIAIWALKNFIDILNKELEKTNEHSKSVQTDLVLAHVRLAIMYQKVSDNKSYYDNISKALALSENIFPDKQYTDESLLAFVKRIDESSK